jgi:hypothetical protein
VAPLGPVAPVNSVALPLTPVTPTEVPLLLSTKMSPVAPVSALLNVYEPAGRVMFAANDPAGRPGRTNPVGETDVSSW